MFWKYQSKLHHDSAAVISIQFDNKIQSHYNRMKTKCTTRTETLLQANEIKLNV